MPDVLDTEKLFYVVGQNVWEMDDLLQWDVHGKLEVACIPQADFLEKIISVCLSNYISLSGKQILIGLLMTTE